MAPKIFRHKMALSEQTHNITWHPLRICYKRPFLFMTFCVPFLVNPLLVFTNIRRQNIILSTYFLYCRALFDCTSVRTDAYGSWYTLINNCFSTQLNPWCILIMVAFIIFSGNHPQGIRSWNPHHKRQLDLTKIGSKGTKTSKKLKRTNHAIRQHASV